MSQHPLKLGAREGAVGRRVGARQKGPSTLLSGPLIDWWALAKRFPCWCWVPQVMEQCSVGGKQVFANGATWAGVTRLIGPPHYHLDHALEKLFDCKERWGDGVRSLHRAVWSGEHDTLLHKLSMVFPSTLDNQPGQMQRRLMEMFTPLITLQQQQETAAARLQTSAEKQAEAAAAEAALAAEAQSAQSPQSDRIVVDGDVTDEMFSDQDAAGKKSLCEALNKDPS